MFYVESEPPFRTERSRDAHGANVLDDGPNALVGVLDDTGKRVGELALLLRLIVGLRHVVDISVEF